MLKIMVLRQCSPEIDHLSTRILIHVQDAQPVYRPLVVAIGLMHPPELVWSHPLIDTMPLSLREAITDFLAPRVQWPWYEADGEVEIVDQ